jgi:O-antigen ligase
MGSSQVHRARSGQLWKSTLLLHAATVALLYVPQQSVAATVLVLLVGLACSWTPLSALAFLVSTWVLPYSAPGLTCTPVGWFACMAGVLARGHLRGGIKLHGGWPLGLLLFWTTVAAFYNSDFKLEIEMLKAVVIGLTALYLYSAARQPRDRVALALLAGLSVFFTVLFFYNTGLASPPLQYFRGSGLVRLWHGRQDPNSTAVIANMIAAGGLGLSAYVSGRSQRILVTIAVLLAIAACVMTDSRGGLVGLAGISVLFAGYAAVGSIRQMRILKRIAIFSSLGIVLVLVLLAVSSTFAGEIRSRFESMVATIQDKGLDTRGRAMGMALDRIAENPIFGGGYGEYYNDQIGSGMAIAVAHNTFLDFALAGGWTGATLFGCFAVLPFIRHASTRVRETSSLPLLLMYAALCFGMLSLSMVGEKAYWMLWCILMGTSPYDRLERAPYPDRPRWRSLGCRSGPGIDATGAGLVSRNRTELPARLQYLGAERWS